MIVALRVHRWFSISLFAFAVSSYLCEPSYSMGLSLCRWTRTFCVNILKFSRRSQCAVFLLLLVLCLFFLFFGHRSLPYPLAGFLNSDCSYSWSWSGGQYSRDVHHEWQSIHLGTCPFLEGLLCPVKINKHWESIGNYLFVVFF